MSGAVAEVGSLLVYPNNSDSPLGNGDHLPDASQIGLRNVWPILNFWFGDFPMVSRLMNYPYSSGLK